MQLSLKGKTAVVCGSTQGIGLAIAEELAQLGAKCILLARNEEALKVAVQELEQLSTAGHSYAVADFAKVEEVKAAIGKIAAQQTIHILINNTGGPAAGPIIDADPNAFVAAFNQHLVNNHNLVQAMVPGMKAEGWGRIINIISTSVKIPLNNLGVSNTIRGAVASWAKTMANELGQYGITVNNVLPGFTNTARLESLIKTNAQKGNKSEEEVAKKMAQEVPAKRFGTAAEVAAVAAFLASPAAAYVNGVSIPVDGGRTGSI
jgi:3-oxoacyl-[acyl-carrier protein] reductase